MLRGPQSGRTAVDYAAKARDAWGTVPDWVAVLAEAAGRSSAAEVARRLGYSPSVVSQVLAARYPGDIGRIEAIVRGALMGSTVECPVLGEIGRDQCRREQARPFVATNSSRARLRRACRACEHREDKP